MALYQYEAFSKDGKKVTGTLDAPTLANVREQLTHQHLFPIVIELAHLEARRSLFSRLFGKSVTTKEKILFTKQLVVLLSSGVPLLQGVELLIEQFEGQLRSMLVTIKDDLTQGISFADALKQYPLTFETIYIQLVRAGEASGQLEPILNRLVQYLERKEELAKKVRGAMQEPIIQIAIISLIVILLLTFVVPKMAESFATSGKPLPAPTRILMAISGFLTGHYILLTLTVVALYSSYKYWRSSARGARQMDQIKLKLPVVKYLSKTNAVVQFSYTLGMLLESGVNLAEALDIVVRIIDNKILADTLNEARDKIVKQGKIAQYLKQTNIFPPIATYLIETGEQSGQLDTMLLSVANNYEKEVEELTERLTAGLKPIIFISMAIVVGFIIMAIALPILQMGDLAGI